MNLVADVGNTFVKLAVFDEGRMAEVCVDDHSLSRLPGLCAKYPVEAAIVSTVTDIGKEVLQPLTDGQIPVLWLDHLTPLPVVNLYETPETLGMDRLAAVVGAWQQCPGRDLLVIDAGTAITYEFLDASGQYHGGNISPGLRMRLQALHDYTGRLPLVPEAGKLPLLGRNTETAIRAGVKRGIEYEIRGYIASLKDKYPELFIFLTGGDEFSFDTNLKSIIFADRFLVLKGLNRILDYNK
ncbi:MAG: type III pantothenate kinase [Bacteroides sp.]|nr:type III pantothenate kinase [Bacteroides sp.]